MSAQRTFPLNAWYCFAWDCELKRELLARTICGIKMVFYRAENGDPVALQDACWHRLLPLSMGVLRGDEVQCKYHGIRYDARGRCSFMPSQETINPSAAVRAFPTALAAYARDRRETFGPWIAAGHSAGAHLAVELALTDWASRGAPADTVAGVVALSGVYDLAPLIRTPLNDNLKLTPESARAASPVFRVNAGAIPALFAVGAEETAAFRRQNQDMALAWSRAGHPAQTLVVEGADHFSLLRGVTHEASPLHQSILTCVSEAVRRSRANN